MKKSENVTKAVFSRAIDLSRTRISQLVKEGLPVNSDGTINVAQAKRWIAQNLDQYRRDARKPQRAANPDTASNSETRGEKLRWEAQLRELEFRKRSGDLVDRAATERVIFERARVERDKLIGAIPRFVAAIASETEIDPRKLFPILDRLLRDHLTELAATPLKALHAT